MKIEIIMPPKFQTYEPKRTLKDILKSSIKPALIFLAILSIITLTALTTKHFLPQSQSITGSAIQQPQSRFYNNEPTITQTQPKEQGKTTLSQQPIQDQIQGKDYTIFINSILESDFLEDLPEDAKISIQFYNFDSGQRELEKIFALSKNSVKESAQSSDIKILMHSKYIPNFSEKDICQIIKEAGQNNDIGFETDMPQSSLIWKYRSMIKYKDCLNI